MINNIYDIKKILPNHRSESHEIHLQVKPWLAHGRGRLSGRFHDSSFASQGPSKYLKLLSPCQSKPKQIQSANFSSGYETA